MSLFFCFSPTYATPKVLEKSGLTLADIDVFEFHEAFAVSASTFTLQSLHRCCIVTTVAPPPDLLYVSFSFLFLLFSFFVSVFKFVLYSFFHFTFFISDMLSVFTCLSLVFSLFIHPPCLFLYTLIK